jgi:hypothetical protein
VARWAVVRRAIERCGMLGELAGAAEELGQAVHNCVDVVAELVDEGCMGFVVEVADEMSRDGGVVEELLQD